MLMMSMNGPIIAPAPNQLPNDISITSKYKPAASTLALDGTTPDPLKLKGGATSRRPAPRPSKIPVLKARRYRNVWTQTDDVQTDDEENDHAAVCCPRCGRFFLLLIFYFFSSHFIIKCLHVRTMRLHLCIV
jgi:hypothetical protein